MVLVSCAATPKSPINNHKCIAVSVLVEEYKTKHELENSKVATHQKKEPRIRPSLKYYNLHIIGNYLDCNLSRFTSTEK